MGALHVRNLDDALIAALEERARRHPRSLRGELRIMEEAVARPQSGAQGDRRLRLRTVRVGCPASLSRDVIESVER